MYRKVTLYSTKQCLISRFSCPLKSEQSCFKAKNTIFAKSMFVFIGLKKSLFITN